MITESKKELLSGRRIYYTTVIDFEETAIRNLADRRPSSDANLPEVEQMHQGAPATTTPRSPHIVHPGDDSSGFTYKLRRCPSRSYHLSSQTFLDLVDESTSFDPKDQRIRIRGGSRRLWTPGELEQRERPVETQGDTFSRRIDDLYKSETGIFWPPDQDLSAPEPALAALYALLNPPRHFGNVHGIWDERSVVYATGGSSGGAKALVFVSFDPSIYLTGAVPYPDNTLLRRPVSHSHLQTSPLNEGKGNREDTAERPEAGVDPALTNGASPASWSALELAKYREIRSYHFAR